MLGNPRPALYTYRDVLVAEFSDVKFSKQLHGTKGVLLEGFDLWNNTDEWRAGYNAFEFKNGDGSKRTVMAFADTAKDIDVKIPATPGVETAVMIDRHNNRQSITAVDGYYELTLEGTKNIAGWPFWDSSLGDYENAIGGATIIIVENGIQAVSAYTITASAGANGSISPSGEVEVAAGEDRTFTIMPVNSDYVIADVKVNGISVGAVGSYTFTDVQSDHSIESTFALRPAAFKCTVKTMSLKVGTGQKIAYDYDGPSVSKPTFESSNPAICAVDNEGNLSPLKAGMAVITIKINNTAVGTIIVTVTN